MTTLISVIIPVYNAGDYLERSVRSVLGQDHKNIEIILVDDGSTDNSFEICKKFASKNENVKVIHTENKGVCHARNTGLQNATGDYISFLDADDELLPSALSFLLKKSGEYDADISVGQKISVENNGKTEKRVYPDKEVLWTGTEGLENSLKDHPAGYSVWGKLYKKEIVSDVRFEVGRKLNEDSFFFFECLLKKPRVLVSDESVIKYYVTDNSASRSGFSEKYFDILYFAEKKQRIIKNMYPELLPLTVNLLLKAHLSLLGCLCRSKDKNYRQTEKASIGYVKANRKSFIAATEIDRKMFRIVTSGTYYIYKILYNLKNKN